MQSAATPDHIGYCSECRAPIYKRSDGKLIRTCMCALATHTHVVKGVN